MDCRYVAAYPLSGANLQTDLPIRAGKGDRRMKTRCLLVVLVTLASLSCAAPLQAQGFVQGFKTFANNMVRDFKRNNCWPEPFVGPDRYSVRAPFALMVHNGWRRQNLLGDYHFEEGTAMLKEVGRLKVRWILTVAPQQHRTIYVHESANPEVTLERIKSVQEVALQYTRSGEIPVIEPTTVDPTGWPAERVDAIDRRWADSIPDPRLPSAQGGQEQ